MKAWHFLRSDGKLRNGQYPPSIGESLIHTGAVEICSSGLHSSKRIIDALNYAPGSIVCRVDCRGIVASHTDKFVCRERTILAMADIADILHLWACDVAEDAMRVYRWKCAASWEAIRVKRQWVKGFASDGELRSARAAAGGAAALAAGAAGEARERQNRRLTRRVNTFLRGN